MLGMMLAVMMTCAARIILFHMPALASYTHGGYIALMHDALKTSIRKRLNRIEGQVRGLSRMVEEDRYFIDILTQVHAVKATLRKVEDEVLKSHSNHCVADAIKCGNAEDTRTKFSELVDLFSKSAR